MRSCTTFLMFQGTAEEALSLYAEAFPDGVVGEIERYGRGEPGPEGGLKLAVLTLAGHTLRLFDSPTPHDFTFTPSVSLFVEYDSEAELRHAYDVLSAEGAELMPLGEYDFSTLFCWIADRFGVSWQLSLQ